MAQWALVVAWVCLTVPAVGAEPDAVPDPARLLDGAALWQQAPPELQHRAVQLLRDRVEEMRAPVKEQLIQHIQERENLYNERITNTMSQIAAVGAVLLLLVPAVFCWRYPGKRGALVRSSVLAAGLFYVTVQMFGLPLVLFCSLSLELTRQLDPRLRVVDPAFDLVDREAEYLLSHDLPLGPTLRQMEDGSVDSFLTLLMENLVTVREQARVFTPLVWVYKELDWLSGLVHLQTLLIVVPFLFSIHPVFVEIVRMPFRAAAGEPGRTWRLIKLALLNWWREVLAVLWLVPIFIGIALLLEMVLDTVSHLSTEAVLGYVLVSLSYLGHESRPNYFLLYLSLGGVMFFFAFNVLVAVLANWFYLQGALRIFRLRCHEKVPLRQYGLFWRRATLALIWVQLLPVLFIQLAVPGVRRLFVGLAGGDPPHHLAALLMAGFTLGGGILLIFRLAGGFRALRFLTHLRIPAARIARIEG